jgi:hypothetical protein
VIDVYSTPIILEDNIIPSKLIPLDLIKVDDKIVDIAKIEETTVENGENDFSLPHIPGSV